MSFWTISASFKEWLSWVDTQRGSRRVRLEVIMVTVVWMIWRYRNALLFDEARIRKNMLFDSIVLFSFNWLKNRDSNSDVVWNSWLLSHL